MSAFPAIGESKGVACWAAARLTGQDNPTSLAIGARMNAGGLMELIIINIGLQRGTASIDIRTPFCSNPAQRRQLTISEPIKHRIYW
jgi:Kef-type K+ transport system membrane component KefB